MTSKARKYVLIVFSLVSIFARQSVASAETAGTKMKAAARAPAQLLSLECGTYKASGRFGLNDQQHFILSINRNSFSPAELLVIGGAMDEKMELVGRPVAIQFYVPQVITGTAGSNVVFLKSIAQTRTAEPAPPPELIKSEACGLDDSKR